ncbi:MAG: GtrA family protein [Clostridia bacterium]|nr:GtrA family protein [Clostridia bacterium]
MKKQNILQICKFVLFSASAGLIQVLSFTLLNELVTWGDKFIDTDYGPNYFIALVLSVLWNFTFNRKYTFKSANNIPIAMLKIFAYYCVFTPLSIWWGIALTKAVSWSGFEYIVLGGTMIINMVTEFLVCKFWVYRNSENTNDIAQKDKDNTPKTKD